MSRPNIAEMNKIALGAIIAIAVTCLAFILRTSIESAVPPRLEPDAAGPAAPAQPPATERQAPNMHPPEANAAEKHTAPAPVIAARRPPDEFDRIVENSEIHRKQVNHLRARAREQSDDPKALSDREIDEIERKGLMLQ